MKPESLQFVTPTVMAQVDARRVKDLMKARGFSQETLARKVGIKQPSIARLIAGDVRNPRHLPEIARALATTVDYLQGETDDPSPRLGEHQQAWRGPPVVADDRTIEIPVIDLAYGMGGTYLDNIDPDARSEPFPLSFIRRYTKAKAEDLVIADGLGDSMAPTIGSSDQLLIDRSLNALRVADQIWCFSFGGVGMVKRLRPRPDGSVAILSDNPAVPEDRAVDDELFLIGRVVAIVRKV